MNKENLRLGSDYGGWVVSLDGIMKDSVVYSFGIGDDVSFDLELVNRCNLILHAFDPTPKSTEWVNKNKLLLTHSNFVFHEYGLSDVDGEINFRAIKPGGMNYTVMMDSATAKGTHASLPCKRLQTIMRELGHEKIDILKLDIEGSEYRAIEDMAACNIRPVQFLVEFHHWFQGVGVSKTKRALKRLREMGYKLYSVSDSGHECSFILNRK